MKERRCPTNKTLRRLIQAGRLMELELSQQQERISEKPGTTADVERIEALRETWNLSLERFRDEQNIIPMFPAIGGRSG